MKAKAYEKKGKFLAGRQKLQLTANARVVLANRYLRKDTEGEPIETPEELFDRVAGYVAEVERKFGADTAAVEYWQRCFYNLMASLRFLPNSPTLMNAGRSLGMLSACFVLPIPDSIDGIFDAVKHTALIQKAGGGTGFSFDDLRPTGDYISSSGGRTSGPVSFWRVLSETTNAIQQGAFRRGANMGMMSLWHPDILKFLYAKADLKNFTNYNISVKITDAWMAELLAEPTRLHVVRNPRTGKEYYLPRALDVAGYDINDLVEVSEAPPESSLFWTVGQLWQVIVSQAHATGEPGVAFIDRINRDNPTEHLGRIEATNPCGEQPLLPYEACNLGSINLARFVLAEGTAKGAQLAEAAGVEALGRVDLEALSQAVDHAVRFLDNVVETNNYQIEQVERICRGNRKIGLGVMGFADALYKLGVAYDSDDGLIVGRELMRFINDRAHQGSEELAAERGCFDNWRGSRWDSERHRAQRNAAVTTVAPTGTISIIADCSGGIEPVFSLVFTRHVLGGVELPEVNEAFKEVAQNRGIYTDQLVDQIVAAGSLSGVAGAPADLARVFVCAHDISPEWHVRMQAAFQEHCDASISKTINFAEDATVEQVDQAYRLAYELKCKGVTVYRDGCRFGQPMSVDSGTQESAAGGMSGSQGALGLPRKPLEPVVLPEIMTCVRVRQLTPFGNMHVKITVDPRSERELEVFAQLGKGGDLANSDLEAMCRLLSLLLRCGGSFELAMKQLDNIGSSLSIPAREGRIMSLGDGLSKAMAKYLQAKRDNGLKKLLLGELDLPGAVEGGMVSTKEADSASEAVSSAGGDGGLPNGKDLPTPLSGFKIKCPACSSTLSFAEGCVTCRNCGFSQC